MSGGRSAEPAIPGYRENRNHVMIAHKEEMRMTRTEKYRDKRDDPQNRIVTIPNILSFFRLCLIPVFVWMYCAEKNFVWTGVILILSGVTDTVDGFVARHFHMTSNLGKVLDPVADKLTQASMLFCLLTRFPLMAVPLAVMVVKECFMGITGLMVIRRTGHVFGADWHGKVTTWLLYAMMILHVFWYDIPGSVSAGVITVCVGMMLLSLALYGLYNIRAIRGKTD